MHRGRGHHRVRGFMDLLDSGLWLIFGGDLIGYVLAILFFKTLGQLLTVELDVRIDHSVLLFGKIVIELWLSYP